MSMVTIKRLNRKFVDIDTSFSMHPVTKDVTKKIDATAIIASIKNLVLTRMFDRPFHPELSSQVYDLLFEQLTTETSAALKRAISYVIKNFEPRAELLYVDVNETSTDDNSLLITIAFRLVGTVENISTQFYLQRSL